MIKNFVVVGFCVGAAIACGLGCTAKTIVVSSTSDAGGINLNPDKGPDTSAPGKDASTTSDGGKVTPADGGTKPTPDAGGMDGGTDPVDPTDPGACAPADTTGVDTSWTPYPDKVTSCTQTQIDSYYEDCMGPNATNATCAPHDMGTDATCTKCIVSRDTDAKHGPVIERGGLVVLNVAACVDAAEAAGNNGSGCGGKLQAADKCQQAACGKTCPVTDQASFDAYQQCTQDAAMGTCAQFVTDAQCQDTLAGDAAACIPTTSFQDAFNFIVGKACL